MKEVGGCGSSAAGGGENFWELCVGRGEGGSVFERPIFRRYKGKLEVVVALTTEADSFPANASR